MIVRVHPAAPPWTFSTEPPPAVSFGGGLVHCKIQCFCTWKFDESRNLASAVADRSQSSLKSWQCHSVRHLGLLGFVLWGSRNWARATALRGIWMCIVFPPKSRTFVTVPCMFWLFYTCKLACSCRFSAHFEVELAFPRNACMFWGAPRVMSRTLDS